MTLHCEFKKHGVTFQLYVGLIYVTPHGILIINYTHTQDLGLSRALAENVKRAVRLQEMARPSYLYLIGVGTLSHVLSIRCSLCAGFRTSPHKAYGKWTCHVSVFLHLVNSDSPSLIVHTTFCWKSFDRKTRRMILINSPFQVALLHHT